MTDQPAQRPEGQLIHDAQKASGKSIRQAAAEAGISDTRWRQLVKGSMATPGGGVAETVAPAATLARMAQVVGVTTEQLANVGRVDAAEVLALGQIELTNDPQVIQGTATVRPATVTVTTAIGAPALGKPRKRAAVDDEIELIYRSQSMTARQKLDAIRMVLQLRLQAEADEARAARKGSTPSEPANNY
jgi:hypothetical protein